MTDEELAAAWGALDPDADARRRIDRRVTAWLEASDTSLAAEWLALFQVSPLPALGLVSVSAVALFMAPLIWLARALL